jgi:hypothetical protein
LIFISHPSAPSFLMHRNRQFPLVIVGFVLLLVAQAALAIGWGRSQLSAELGQPLNFTAMLRLDPGDSVDAGCVAAEVAMGEQRLPPHMVRLAVDGPSADELRMRVQTLSAIDEPVVTVTLAIGCPGRMSRRFVLLVDPPAARVPTVIAAAAPGLVAEAMPVATAASAPVPRAAPATAREAPPAASRPRPAPRPTPVVKAPRPAAPVAPAAAAAPVGPGPRLQLDPAEPPLRLASPEARVIDEAIEAVAQAASAARAAASAASAAEQRIAALEATVAQLRADSSANRELAAKMGQRLAEAEGSDRWLTPLLLAVAALASLALWLVSRLRSLTEERQRAWQRAAAAEAAAAGAAGAIGSRPATPTSQLPLVTSEIMPLSPPRVPARSAWPPASHEASVTASVTASLSGSAPDDVDPAMARTDVLPAHARPDAGAARDLTIEELLDLEQQAEFFIVLGQDEAAIDLLVEHLRSTGGGSPLPYLKLLEIYRRRNERDAYERTRARFNDRFNAYAPDWDTDLQQGRSLEDYAGVLPRLQQVWPRPIDAMAELEALLFRKSRGELFELPAYREVLFLYTLARDLLDHEAVVSGEVDLLLPLSDDAQAEAVTAPMPVYLGAEGDSVFDRMGDVRPTAPVDLDLTQPDPEPGIVDPLLPRLPRR